ncbi:hypothetical protein A1OQ_01715 [Enterovibrio norvegicus FF-162]|uniref:hypothetical protein n=1 Tax=Enterovibrio norvegicus TaxID=188144 RepID=UPI0003168BF5|nr:hypothetical protein [Enterovibrio norvegicus]OEE90021.1 hypothetical protein A1OQ_01715 [Enterovibrio norvegicus FF-162]
MNDMANLTKTSTRLALLSLSLFLMSGVVSAYAAEEVDESEVVEVESGPMTAIEVIIGKRIPDTVIEGERPPHVYRPRTPIFHHHHPENEPVPPKITKHLLVDHPELNNNQGRIIRTPPDSGSTDSNTGDSSNN